MFRLASTRKMVQVRTSGLTIVGPRTAVLDGTGLAGSNGIDVEPSAGMSDLQGFRLGGGLSVSKLYRERRVSEPGERL